MTGIIDDLLALITEDPGDSTPMLVEDLRERGHKTSGDHILYAKFNVMMWAFLAQPVAEAFEQLEAAGAIHAHALTEEQALVLHLAEGMPTLTCPYAGSSPPRGGYKRPRWIAATWYPGSKSGSGACSQCRYISDANRNTP